MSAPQLTRISRRDAIKWMLTAAAAAAVLDRTATGAAAPKPATGYGTDPDLIKDYKPGDLWPLTFDDAQRRTAAALCDVIIPEDAKSPSASALHVHEFIDEWVSAPYPAQQNDRGLILPGLDWLEAESLRRFKATFAKLKPEQQRAICDDICFEKTAQAQYRVVAAFFSRFRSLAAGAYYATPEGWKAIGYVGNTPMANFDGPPPEVLAKLGVEQTVK